MELWDRRERRYRTFPEWTSTPHTYHRSIREPSVQAPAGFRAVKNRGKWRREGGLSPDHETEQQRALMERQRGRRELEMMVQRGDFRNQWQPMTTPYRGEENEGGFGGDSYGELEEWQRRCYYPSLQRRTRLQGKMWSEIQTALKAEKIAQNPVCAEPCQRSGIYISESNFNPVPSHQLPPYTSVKHHTTLLPSESRNLSSYWSQPPNYTPPPPYSARPEPEPDRCFPDLGMEYRTHPERQLERSSVPFSDRRPCSSVGATPGAGMVPGPDRTPHQQEPWPSVQQQVKKVLTSQSGGHHKKHQTTHSNITLNEAKRRRSGGTLFCLVSHMAEPTGLSSSPNEQPHQCQSLPLLKKNFSGYPVQLADEADSGRSLTSFQLDSTSEEPGRERPKQNVEEVRKDREEVRKLSTETGRSTDQSKRKGKAADSNMDEDNLTPAVSSKSTSPVVPHHRPSLKVPLWKEPKSQHCSNDVLNRSFVTESQCEQPRHEPIPNENAGLMVIDATCVVIKVEFIVPPEKEHVRYINSPPTGSSGSEHDHRPEQTTDRSSEHRVFNQSEHTSSRGQPEHETSKERAERILGIELQNSFHEEHTLEETGQRAEAESEIPVTLTPNEEQPSSSVSESEAMLEISEVTHRDVVNFEFVETMNAKKENKLKSEDRKTQIVLDETIPTTVTDIKEQQVKDRCEGRPSGEPDCLQKLDQTIVRNTTEGFSQKCKRREALRRDERQDLDNKLFGRSVESTPLNEPFSQEDTPTEGNSSREDPGENIQNPCSIFPNSSERGTNEVLDQEHTDANPKTSVRFSLEGGHHQENLFILQNLCPNPLSTSETLDQESSPNQNLSSSGDPKVDPPFHGDHMDHMETIHEDGSALNISDTHLHEDILREDGPSHAEHDADHLHQTLPANKEENMSEEEDVLGEENLLSDGNDDQSLLHEGGVENLSSVLLVDQCVSLNEDKLPETVDMKTFSPNLFENSEELFQQEESGILLDDLQNLCPVLPGVSVENSNEVSEREDNEVLTSPNHDRLSRGEELTLSLLSDSEISPGPPACCPSPPACSSHPRPADTLSEVTSDQVQVCSSSASSRAQKQVRESSCAPSLWDAVSRIRKHTAPDSETEDEDGELWESVGDAEDGLSENPETEGEQECVQGERVGYTGNHGEDPAKDVSEHQDEEEDEEEEDEEEEEEDEEEEDEDGVVSSSSVDSQDTVIEGESKLNILEPDEDEDQGAETERTENKV